MAQKLRLDRREGEGGGGGDRGVIDWLARLIGVQGKTLGVNISKNMNFLKGKSIVFFCRNFYENIKFMCCMI